MKPALFPNLEGKVAIVTGGGRGIGRAICLALGACGATVAIAARTESEIQAVEREIIENGGKAKACPCDIADESQIRQLFNSIKQVFGRLDILINNAAIGLYGPLESFPIENLDKMLSINLRGAYICCQEAIQLMALQENGTIINISSVVGFKGYSNQSAYTASKHALVGMTKSLAKEVQKYNIRVSLIHPGGVDTNLAGDARPDLDRSELMQPQDIAHTVLFLLSLSDRCAVDEIYIRRCDSSPF